MVTRRGFIGMFGAVLAAGLAPLRALAQRYNPPMTFKSYLKSSAYSQDWAESFLNPAFTDPSTVGDRQIFTDPSSCWFYDPETGEKVISLYEMETYRDISEKWRPLRSDPEERR